MRPTTRSAAIDAAVEAFYEAVAGVMPSVFVLEHGRLWLVAQRGYAVVPDGIGVGAGNHGSRGASWPRASSSPTSSRIPTTWRRSPSVTSELAVPLRQGRVTVGVLNVESERPFPDGALKPASAGAPRSRLGPRRSARRESSIFPGSLGSSSISEACATRRRSRRSPQLRLLGFCPSRRARSGSGTSSASRPSSRRGAQTERSGRGSRWTSSKPRALDDPSVVCQLLDLAGRKRRKSERRPVVWLPLRANAGELGALVGTGGGAEQVDPTTSTRPRCSPRTRGVARRRVRASARASERDDGSADGSPEPARARGAARARAGVRTGAPGAAEPARHRLRRLQGDQRPRRSRVRRRASSRGRGRALAVAAGRRRGRAPRRRRVRRHAPGSRRRDRRGARRADPERSRRRADRRGLSAQAQRRDRDLSLRRSDADGAPASRRPGALSREAGREGSRRVVSAGRSARRAGEDDGEHRGRRRAQAGPAAGTARSSPTPLRRRRPIEAERRPTTC